MEDETIDDMAVWNLVRPLLRTIKPKSLETSIYNGGDTVETRVDAVAPPGITVGFELKPGKVGLSCPEMYETISVSRWSDSKELRLTFRTRGTRGDTESCWQTHSKAVADLCPKGMYMAEEHIVKKQICDTTERIATTTRLLEHAKKTLNGG
jgi:hypothetical protein